jgi:hypothetical protein
MVESPPTATRARGARGSPRDTTIGELRSQPHSFATATGDVEVTTLGWARVGSAALRCVQALCVRIGCLGVRLCRARVPYEPMLRCLVHRTSRMRGGSPSRRRRRRRRSKGLRRRHGWRAVAEAPSWYGVESQRQRARRARHGQLGQEAPLALSRVRAPSAARAYHHFILILVTLPLHLQVALDDNNDAGSAVEWVARHLYLPGGALVPGPRAWLAWACELARKHSPRSAE